MNKKLTKDEFPNEEDKPCPFCASRDIICEQTDVGEGWIVWCKNCGCFGPNDLGWSGAIEMWNLRRPMTQVEVLHSNIRALIDIFEKDNPR